MVLATLSAIMSFYEGLEDRVSRLYEDVSRSGKCPEHIETIQAFSRESRRLKESVLRAYREVITDAFEVGYSFTGLKEEEYWFETEITEDLSCPEVIRSAIAAEEKSRRFCIDAGESSKAFLADIPQALKRVAENKFKRIGILRSMLEALA